MRPILFDLGSLNFYSYGFFSALSFIAAGVVLHYLAGRKRLINSRTREYFVIDALLFSLIIAILISRLSYIVLYSFIFQTEPVGLGQNPLAGGFVFYPGLAAGLSAYAWWLVRHKEAVLPWFDVLSVVTLGGFGISEIGGYLNDGEILT
jgi:prolipoprotein diacylglyceryltransferase